MSSKRIYIVSTITNDPTLRAMCVSNIRNCDDVLTGGQRPTNFRDCLFGDMYFITSMVEG